MIILKPGSQSEPGSSVVYVESAHVYEPEYELARSLAARFSTIT
jgi:predicted Rossmann-fold nucleotide-binding protein